MIRQLTAVGLFSTVLLANVAWAEDALVVSTWGGSFRDLIDENIGKEFTRQTGVPVKYVTGGTIDRLNKAKLAKTPESDITFTTSHIGWLYVDGGLFEKLDTAKLPNYANLVDRAKVSPYHVGSWAYVYTIGYRPDLVPKDIKFDSWNDLWNPALKGKLSAPRFRPQPHHHRGRPAIGRRCHVVGKRHGQAQGPQAQFQGVLHQRRQQPAVDGDG